MPTHIKETDLVRGTDESLFRVLRLLNVSVEAVGDVDNSAPVRVHILSVGQRKTDAIVRDFVLTHL